jgi:hypothetical protein
MMITRGVRSVVERHGLMTIVGFSIRGMATTNRMFSFLLCSRRLLLSFWQLLESLGVEFN